MKHRKDRHAIRAWALVLALAATSATLIGLDALADLEHALELAMAPSGRPSTL
jgi:hypothetical protein